MTEYKKLDDPLDDLTARYNLVKKWQSRIERLQKNGTEMQEFCLKHDIGLSWLSHAKKMKKIPYWKSIERVEKAFKAEGV